MLNPDEWGNAYEYPALYTMRNDPMHKVFDQSDANRAHGDWVRFSDFDPAPDYIDNTKYYLYNDSTKEEVQPCNLDNDACNGALNAEGFIMLDPSERGYTTYQYPAIYNLSANESTQHKAWDQSEDKGTHGDWTMYSVSNPPPAPITEPEDYLPPNPQNNIVGTKKDDDLRGSQNSDFIDGKKGDDTLTGLKDDDVLQGAKGDDFLKGGKGDDYLDGSKGTDILKGGKGADVFQISKGLGFVEDFSINQGDRVGLLDNGKYSIVDDPDGVIVQANDNKQLFLDSGNYDDVIAAGVDLFVQPV